MLRDVYDLLTGRRHDPPAQRLNTDQWYGFKLGYDYALVIALRVLQHARDAHRLNLRDRRLAAKARMHGHRERRERLRLLLRRECTWRATADGEFCRAPAAWMLADAGNRPIELRCKAHRTPECEPLPALELERALGR